MPAIAVGNPFGIVATGVDIREVCHVGSMFPGKEITVMIQYQQAYAATSSTVTTIFSTSDTVINGMELVGTWK